MFPSAAWNTEVFTQRPPYSVGYHSFDFFLVILSHLVFVIPGEAGRTLDSCILCNGPMATNCSGYVQIGFGMLSGPHHANMYQLLSHTHVLERRVLELQRARVVVLNPSSAAHQP